MVLKLRLRKISNSVGLVLPKKVLAHLKVGEGDTVCLATADDGSVRITANPEVSRQMEVVRDVMRRYRHTLRELAKCPKRNMPRG